MLHGDGAAEIPQPLRRVDEEGELGEVGRLGERASGQEEAGGARPSAHSFAPPVSQRL